MSTVRTTNNTKFHNLTPDQAAEAVNEIVKSCSEVLTLAQETLRLIQSTQRPQYVITNSFTSQEVNDNIVQVIRHVRPTVNTVDQNMYGITFLFEIDYDRDEVTANWSICNGDNFDKNYGIAIAKSKSYDYTFSLADVDYYSGLVPALLVNISYTLNRAAGKSKSKSNIADEVMYGRHFSRDLNTMLEASRYFSE